MDQRRRHPLDQIQGQVAVSVGERVESGAREHVEIGLALRDGIRRAWFEIEERHLAEERAAPERGQVTRLAPGQRPAEQSEVLNVVVRLETAGPAGPRGLQDAVTLLPRAEHVG